MSKKAKNKPNPNRAERANSITRNLPVAILSGLGFVLTAVLLFTAKTQSDLPYCGVGSSCDVVQHSRWSNFLGLPIAAWGLALYGALVCGALFVKKTTKRWHLTIFLGTVGFGVSVYLNAISLWLIKATCVYCLMSFGLITAIFLLTLTAPALPDLGRWRIGSTIAAVIVVAFMALHYAGVFDPAAGPEDPYLVELAEHLKTTDAKFYGAYWCPHCQDQKKIFGASASRLPYIECSPNGQRGAPATACLAANIRNYPTWEFAGRQVERTLSARQLARYSGFRPPPDDQ